MDEWDIDQDEPLVIQVSNNTVHHRRGIRIKDITFRYSSGEKVPYFSNDYRTEIFNNDTHILTIYEYIYYAAAEIKYLEEGYDKHDNKIIIKLKRSFKCREDKKLYKRIYG